MANKISAEKIGKIQNMSYNELGKAVVSGEFSIKELRQAYSQMRSTASKRIQVLDSPKNVTTFGKHEHENFRYTKNLITTSELLKEIRDVSKFLQTKSTTITGLREQRNWLIEKFKEDGFNVTNVDYPNLVKFLKWFKASEFSKKYGSDQPETAEVWNSEKPNEEDWRRAFEQLKGTEQKSAPVRQY